MHRLAVTHLLPRRGQKHINRREVLTVSTQKCRNWRWRPWKPLAAMSGRTVSYDCIEFLSLKRTRGIERQFRRRMKAEWASIYSSRTDIVQRCSTFWKNPQRQQMMSIRYPRMPNHCDSCKSWLVRYEDTLKVVTRNAWDFRHCRVHFVADVREQWHYPAMNFTNTFHRTIDCGDVQVPNVDGDLTPLAISLTGKANSTTGKLTMQNYLLSFLPVFHLIVSDTKSVVLMLRFIFSAIILHRCCIKHVFNTFDLKKLMWNELVSIWGIPDKCCLKYHSISYIHIGKPSAWKSFSSLILI